MDSRIKILFLCTGNCCRSQMAEAILKHVGGDRFTALSAGSHPARYIHPLAIHAMQMLRIPMTGQHSKSWDEFATEPIDLIITLCDAAAKEPCPIWPESPMTVHWPHPDPAALIGSDTERQQFAESVAARLKSKIEALVKLDFENTLRDDLLSNIRKISDL